MRPTHPAAIAVVALSIALIDSPAAPSDFATQVISYDPGSNATPGYTDSATALGPPERFTGEGIFPGVVSVFSSAWRPDEIVSIGAGGHLVVRFDSPVTDDPHNLFGIDLIVFGNAAFSDDAYPAGQCGTPCSLFSEGGEIAVSADGVSWVAIDGVAADDLFPTQGYADVADPYAPDPGLVETDFTRPVDPRLTPAHFDGLAYADILALYNGSGGGAGIDLAPTGLSAISYVRISNPAGAFDTPDIDAFADVTPRLPGDVDLDGLVTVSDLLLLLAAWGPSTPGDPPADFDGSGTVDISDLLVLLANWTGSP